MRGELQLLLLCAAFTRIAATAITVNTTDCDAVVAAAWQSSSEAACFNEQLCNSSIEHFYSSEFEPKQAWLLLKLSNANIITSVTVTANYDDADAANAIAVSLAHSRHAFQLTSKVTHHCEGNITVNESLLTHCGVTHITNSTVNHPYEVNCCDGTGCDVAAQYILFRKNMENISHKFMAFAAVHITLSQPKKAVTLWNMPDVITVNASDIITTKISSTEGMPQAQHNCHVTLPLAKNEKQKKLRGSKVNGTTTFTVNATKEMNNGSLVCTVKQGNMVQWQQTFRADIFVIYTVLANWNFYNKMLFIEGETMKASISSGSQYEDSSMHICFVSLPRIVDNTLVEVMYAKEISRTSEGLSSYSLKANREMNNGFFECLVNYGANKSRGFMLRSDIVVYYKSKTKWTQFSKIVAIEGDAIITKLKSTEGNPEPKHFCEIIPSNSEIDQSFKFFVRLELDRVTAFTVNASRFMNNGVLQCSVEQGNMTGWSRKFTADLNVLFPATTTWNLQDGTTVIEFDPITIAITSTEGNPAPSHKCHVNFPEAFTGQSKQYLTGITANGTTTFTVNATRSMHNGSVIGSVNQQNMTIWDQSLTTRLNVLYEANTVWNHQKSITIIEGNEFTTEIKSGNGNPQPSHNCHMLIAARGNESSEIIELVNDGNGVTTFTVNATREMLDATVICEVTQGEMTRWDKTLSAKINVLYPSISASDMPNKISFTEGDLIETQVNSSDGNPSPISECHVTLPALRNGKTQKMKKGKIIEGATTFTVNASGLMDNGFIICSVKQGNMKIWDQNFTSFVNVLHKASTTWSHNNTIPVIDNTAFTTVIKSVRGNPQPSHNCHMILPANGKESSEKIEFVNNEIGVSTFTVNATRDIHDAIVICEVTQGEMTRWDRKFTATVNVLYESFSHSNQSAAIKAIEGETIRIRINSSNGNPKPNQECKIGNIDMEKKSISDGISIFTVKARNIMNNAELICSVKQNGQESWNKIFKSPVTVLHKTYASLDPKNMTVRKLNVPFMVKVTTVGGNPIPKVKCFINFINSADKSPGVEELSLVKDRTALGVITFEATIIEKMKNTAINCLVTQGNIRKWDQQLKSVIHIKYDRKTATASKSNLFHLAWIIPVVVIIIAAVVGVILYKRFRK